MVGEGREPARTRDGPRAATHTTACDDLPVTTPPVAPSPSVPTRIHADREARTLEIAWQDGHVTTYDFTALRWLCPCAYCRGEAGMPGWLDSNPTLTADQTRLVDVALVGNYAIQPTWGDGHATGFHSFTLLRDHCPCAECAGLRERRTTDGQHRHGGDR